MSDVEYRQPMTRSLLQDAFAHHVWATQRLIDSCLSLSPGQLASEVAGTYGSILSTMRHIVDADSGYLNLLTGGRVAFVDEDQLDLNDLRTAMTANGAAWASLLGTCSEGPLLSMSPAR